ncbi:MAG: hypothetical protein UY81_C0047G0002 [Candidatus Giovannonibacteria bacterium GW2011_GWA2_53_7]|uniref:Uncharacterized protein n=1 Tax=Candidatus Giovannonibacteria bacterium GW2011_GWA2_53_7 TaxID=1618650 RepID=A0A0G1XWH3_9BACT|nr:MAG: hypothetical protein UY81_C0047G0002 [Candidatus Giovannonibacteria bacterium GW2011_GWA2_53_7]
MSTQRASTSLEDFQKEFGLHQIARLIAKKELPGAKWKEQSQKEDEIIKQKVKRFFYFLTKS